MSDSNAPVVKISKEELMKKYDEPKVYYWFKVGNGRDLVTQYKDEITKEALKKTLIEMSEYERVLDESLKLEARIAALRKALEFYGDENEWRGHYFKLPTATFDYKKDPVEFNGFQHAKLALAADGEK